MSVAPSAGRHTSDDLLADETQRYEGMIEGGVSEEKKKKIKMDASVQNIYTQYLYYFKTFRQIISLNKCCIADAPPGHFNGNRNCPKKEMNHKLNPETWKQQAGRTEQNFTTLMHF